MRTAYIKSSVRPVKKLFVLESNDYESFSKIFREVQEETDGIFNLIYVNDCDIWSVQYKEFVKRNVIDIIINFSELTNDQLSAHFGITSVKYSAENKSIRRYGTSLYGFTKHPFFENQTINVKDDNWLLAAKDLTNTPFSLAACLNFGLAANIENDTFEGTIFNNVKIEYINSSHLLSKKIFSNNKFCHITTELGAHNGFCYGISIYEVNYNKDKLFEDFRNYIFISKKNDFKAISYFWNTRLYYHREPLAWFPVDLLEEIHAIVDLKTVFVCFDKEIEKKILSKYKSNDIITPKSLHFKERNERWAFLEHDQTVTFEDENITIHHPISKSFTEFGPYGAYILEIRGLNEFAYPIRKSIGKLFSPYVSKYDPLDYFYQITNLGLSSYQQGSLHTSKQDLIVSLKLPSFKTVIEHIFEEVGYTISKSQKSSILDQTINLFGGLEEIKIVSNKQVFDLLLSLTPRQRTEKIVSKALEGIQERIPNDNILEILASIRDKGAINFPSVILTIDDIISNVAQKSNGKKVNKWDIFPVLQKLYDQRVFLRGKYFECLSCGSNLWLQIDEINRVNYCIECSNLVNIPISYSDKQSSDYYRLNQLIIRAIDQGQLATILLLNVFYQQKYRFFNYLSNIEIYKDEKLITDIDILIRIGRRIGIVECKSVSGFDDKQVQDLLEIALKLKVDFVAFSCLLSETSSSILDLVGFLDKKLLVIPVFIFTSETLFNGKVPKLQGYFETGHTNEFKTGPIIIK